MNEELVTQTDASEESSTSQPSDSAVASPEASAPQVETNPEAPKEAPFHEHPRFKELIEQNRAYKSDLAQLQKQISELSKPKEPTSQPQVHPFIADLEKVNPAYAEYIKGLEAKVQDIEGIKSWKSQYEQQSLLKEYESSVSKMFDENKVSEPLRAIYKELLDSKAMSGQYGLNDLPNVFKDVHGKLSGILEAQKREATAAYVQDKTKAASIPASAPKTPSVTKKAQGWKPSGNSEQDIIDIARMAVEEARAKNS